MKPPFVSLVGAGPGDPGLLTVRGLRRLEAADVVVYDHVVPARLLASARPDAELIDVGPAAPRPLDQDAISFLIAEKAREGKWIVRLKWGDPFVFDSGAKEALFLHEQGIPFEVVPGVPAGLGVPAYAGVPVTYPEAGDVLTFVRGDESETDTPPRVDWAHVAASGGPIVCYAGARQLPAIVDGLIRHGRPADEPAVFVAGGTTPEQRTVDGTLGTLVAEAGDLARRGRGILVVGPVVGLRQHLRWFDERPLFGRRIVVTRSREQAGELADLLEERGAVAVLAPTARLAPPERGGELDRVCGDLARYDWVVFSSANAVERLLARIAAGPGDVRDLKGIRLCTVGPSAADRLRRLGIRVDLTPAESRPDTVIEGMRGFGAIEGRHVLVLRGDAAREALADELRKLGAEVDEVAAYRMLPVTEDSPDGPDLYRLLLDRQVDAVVFTSASAVRGVVTLLGAEPAADLLATTVVACIGPVTAEAAQQLGIATTVMPSTYTIPALVDALVEHFRTKPDGRSAGL